MPSVILSFSIIIQMSTSAGTSHVFLQSNLGSFLSSKRQNNFSNISRWTLTGLKQLSFTWFSINHVLVSNLIIRIFWGAFVSRSFTFTVPQRRNALHFTSSEEPLLFISQSALDCIALCLDHFNLILLRHIIGDIERPLIFRSFYVSICSAVIKILFIYITSSRISA